MCADTSYGFCTEDPSTAFVEKESILFIYRMEEHQALNILDNYIVP